MSNALKAMSFVRDLRDAGCLLAVDQGRLEVYPAQPLSEADLATLHDLRNEIADIVEAPDGGELVPVPDEVREWFDGLAAPMLRVAFTHMCRGMARQQPERFADTQAAMVHMHRTILKQKERGT